ncbi:MAG: SDR family NAD(P)-dependent oxidoreductase [Spirochaetota bacterium]|nr:SDR family NAD(P)-dependent oxidoreductase [Spirochaetota bacterium]
MKKRYPSTVCITGASSGIGFETAKALAGGGALVIGIGRSPEHCEEAARRIRRSLQGPKSVQGDIRFVHADLSSLAAVRTAASAVSAILAEHGYQYLDVLINNAVVVPSRRTVTDDGYELQWTVNHLAPFLLSHQLLPLLAGSDDARILTVSSRSHRIGRIRLKDPNLASGYNLLKALWWTSLQYLNLC